MEAKQNIEALAAAENKNPLEIISMLQVAAAKIGDTKTLDALCELKWEFI